MWQTIGNQDLLQTEEERRRTDVQTKCRTRQIVDMSGRLMDKRNRKRVLVEWCLCMDWIQSIWSQDDCWKSRRDDFARISTRINGRLVSVCIAPLSVCIYIAVTAISFICIGSKPNEARSFLNAETSIEVGTGHLGISSQDAFYHSAALCANPLFAVLRDPALLKLRCP